MRRSGHWSPIAHAGRLAAPLRRMPPNCPVGSSLGTNGMTEKRARTSLPRHQCDDRSDGRRADFDCPKLLSVDVTDAPSTGRNKRSFSDQSHSPRVLGTLLGRIQDAQTCSVPGRLGRCHPSNSDNEDSHWFVAGGETTNPAAFNRSPACCTSSMNLPPNPVIPQVPDPDRDMD